MRWALGLLHCLHGVLGVLCNARHRGCGVLVFTHSNDMNAQGVDEQMGPLLDYLRATETPVMEVSLVPLRGLGQARRFKSRGFVSWAAIAGPARLLAWVSPLSVQGARVLLTRWLLWMWRPRAVMLIDESGSGQSLVRAAKTFGIPSLGIQHGDFRPGNPQYAPVAGEPFERAAVDCLCLWSEWFQQRLLSISPIYTAENTCVTGRLRGSAALAVNDRNDPGGQFRVLALMENDSEFAEAIEPYLQALDLAPEIHLQRREHPASGLQVNQSSLHEQLSVADAVLGVRSSALWEAVAFRLPVVVPMTTISRDREALMDAGALAAESPGHLVELCLRLSTEGISQHDLAAAYRRLWGVGHGSVPAAMVDALKLKIDIDEAKKTSGMDTHAG